MGRRLIKIVHNNEHTAKVYFEYDNREYQVEFYTNGKHLVDATAFTDDKEDAIGTAEGQLRRTVNAQQETQK